ncbi:MAG: repair protein RecN, partial [Actinomycetota bacterium]|nr:repair protein RecN [Actinomycetota bacterium]
AALSRLTRKYGATASEVLAWAQQAAARLTSLEGDDDRIGVLQGRRSELLAELGQLARALSRARGAAAARFAAAVSGELEALAMPQARITVDVRQTESASGLDVDGRTLAFGALGVDDVEMQLCPHPGAPARPLQRGASGGELSRVMLAVEVVFAGTDPVPTFVFDEVDAGVGGKAAVEVGRRLALLARTAQVLVVTHLPQVAVFADAQVAVEKLERGGRTVATARRLDDADRVIELSRMLSGQPDSAVARGHATELLAVAARQRGAKSW